LTEYRRDTFGFDARSFTQLGIEEVGTTDPTRVLPQEQVVRLVAQADKREFSLFLGAGASRSSGIPLASEMVHEWRQLAFREQSRSGDTLNGWCAKQAWFGQPNEYSLLFEALYPDERARQKFIEPKIESAFPAWGYLYLANIIREGHFNLVFTTNFDDLLNEALTRFIGYNAVVCAADSEVATINASTARAKIVKLHGDYLFKKLKNTSEDLQRLTDNMERKFAEFARQCGMLVVGYAGADQSIMELLDKLLQDVDTFPGGIYWGLHDPEAALAPPLQRLFDLHPKRLRPFRCEDFDDFVARLHERLQLPAPLTIAEPLASARTSVERLLALTTLRQRANATISAHAERLAQQRDSAIAQVAEPDVLELFEAEIALGQRDHAAALAHVERYAREHPRDARVLTIWGAALMMQGEDGGGRDLYAAAADKWREAIRCDPKWTSARYNLVRYHWQRQEFREAIAEAEALLELAPHDANLKNALAQLYGGAGRTREALEIVDALLADDPGAAQLHFLRGTLLEQRGRPVEALRAVERALQIAPANAWLRIQAAQCYARLARPREAGSEFVQAIQLDPANTGFRIQAAQFFLTTNQAPQALMHLREAAQREPESAEVRGWLATTHMAMNALQDARREIDVALRLAPDESRLLATAGQIYAACGDPAQAEGFVQRAIDANPNAVGPYALLAQIYAHWQRWDRVQETMQRIAAIDPQVAQQLQMQLQAQSAGWPRTVAPSTAAFGSVNPQLAAAAQKLFDWFGGGGRR
jgi:tetratricopeptide (TPR) repeat protein